MGELDGKVTVITGAGSGIGRAAVDVFAAAGATVVAVDLDPVGAEAAAAAVGGVAVAGSVADPATWDVVLEAAAAHGGPHVAYLNAGVYGWQDAIEELPLDLYQRTVDTNVSGVVLGVRALVPAMRALGGGAIVATASVAGIVAFSPNPLYTMTKYAVTGFVQAMAPRLTVDGITIDAVCPSVVDTPMTTEALKGGSAADLGIPMISPMRIAETALRLATTDGTGRCVAIIDGVADIEWRFPDFVDLLKAAPQPDA